MQNKKAAVNAALVKLSTFLEPYLPIVNTHMVTFYTGNVWEQLDERWREDLMNLNYTQLAELPHDFLNLSQKKPDHISSHLLQLMEDISSHTLDALNVLDDLTSVWQQMEIKPLNSLIHFEEFMTVKKSHEVAALCDVIASLANDTTQNQLIVDLGCGRGALASMLSLNHGLYVSGIDAAGFNVHIEEGRQSKIQKTFKSKVKKQRMMEEDDHQTDLSVRFRRTTLHLTNNFDLGPLISECSDHFQQSFLEAGLVGLHTCGNLASTSMQLFVNCPQARFLCNVGCCYHLLDELFEKRTCKEDDHQGFPLSSYLKSKQYVLGRNARMVSSQPLERYATRQQMQPDVLFYRSLLEVILQEKLPSSGDTAVEYQVGRLRKPVANFHDYFRWAIKKLQLNLELTDSEIGTYLALYEGDGRKNLYAFFQLRLLLASLVEFIILLDRLAFLTEQEVVSHSFLVKIFSPVTSPRCYALLAFKNKETEISK